MKTLRLILGDQLNSHHSWFQTKDDSVIYLMAEVRQETDYVKHHIQKVTAFFLAMRHFAKTLQAQGHQVRYYKISNEDNLQDFELLIQKEIALHSITHFEYQLPDEYRLDEQLKTICSQLNITSRAFDTEHFYTNREELASFFQSKKQLFMESFYRMMRKKHQVMMVGEQPLGNQWNFDHDNRKKYKGEVPVPKAKQFPKKVSTIVDEIQQAGVSAFGNIDPDNFGWPISRDECLELLDYFCNNLLPYFGTYEDAMYTQEKQLFHSRLSFAMNSKMLSPKEVIDTVVAHYHQNQEIITLAQVEGFVRQIIGWREYVRGIYWKEMPQYAQMNVLENHEPLPDFYWTGQTKMHCMSQAINQSLDDAYAHHIQRLMIIGNFSLLSQRHPDAVDAWYLGVYIDAIEWVELPNTRGMSQYADGGILATKPYVSSGSYINKMSNYCESCHYNVKDKLGDNACPFNSLYWNFLDDKKQYFKNNQRMAMMLNLLNKIPAEELYRIKEKAAYIIQNPDLY
ncbi:cryptochrome/photolyase family protein [Flavobacterium sp. J49]|uniref:cryptochrome/photolyase family protein n=1 Tax=Flavobacterium sp. J49 TaxID=2718534 RepID=UPI0015936C19|nr:cryptochrome/photolyase family protein [Flavobacterium sp. J49]MBF6641919.1 cryptochrome/photolyase family protein [Flavobacterium sp. J49]NIC03166.1 cryptochrome/photolyase family protein [Flavobacterium sp. J49]